MPSWLTQQSYPYVTPGESVEKGITTGETGNAQLNCLLYCEMFGNRTPPTYPTLAWHGNFVIPTSNDTPASDGTFALGYHFFMEKYLLPRLQPLNQASIIIPEVSDETATITWSYTVGKHPDHPDSTADYYQFKREKGPGGQSCYAFRAKLPSQPGFEVLANSGGSGKYNVYMDHSSSFYFLSSFILAIGAYFANLIHSGRDCQGHLGGRWLATQSVWSDKLYIPLEIFH